MNIRSAVFALVSIRPSTINEVIKKLPYSEGSVYNVIEDMLREGELSKDIKNGDHVLSVPNDYHSQKLKEIHVKSLSHGIDPEYILREHVFDIWKNLEENDKVEKIVKGSNYSEKWVRRIIKVLADYDLIIYVKKRPIVVKKNQGHIVANLLDSLAQHGGANERIIIPGKRRFEQIFASPDEIERGLYERIEKSISVKKTGWMIKGGNDIAIYESVPGKLSDEELFVLKINTPEGVEDICIQYLFNMRIDIDKLLIVAKERDMVNEVGCYLDIINDIAEGSIPYEKIDGFLKNISKRKRVFLEEEIDYGKGGWEDKYEKKWNLDIYLDIGSIKHGVRSL